MKQCSLRLAISWFSPFVAIHGMRWSEFDIRSVPARRAARKSIETPEEGSEIFEINVESAWHLRGIEDVSKFFSAVFRVAWSKWHKFRWTCRTVACASFKSYRLSDCLSWFLHGGSSWYRDLESDVRESFLEYTFFQFNGTVDGRNPAPVEVGSLSR